MPSKDERHLFEMIVLEGFQSGLSWRTILGKRQAFRKAFEGFDPERVARFGEARVKRLLGDAGIVRHRGKIEATVQNARALRALHAGGGSLAALAWSAVGGSPRVNRLRRLGDAPAETPESKALSKALKARGFGFVGPTTVYAFMQAVGLVNDHVEGCASRDDVERARRAFERPRAVGT